MFDTSYVHFTYILLTNVSYFPCQTFIPILRSRCFYTRRIYQLRNCGYYSVACVIPVELCDTLGIL